MADTQKREYRFYGNEQAGTVMPVVEGYERIKNLTYMYDILSEIWSKDTCAPRMRDEWSPENRTCGQCSITAFLIQDIFGGDVYGVQLEDGNYHCYNVIDGKIFDLTSEQFGDERLDYSGCTEQFREVHFAKEEKKQRYENLKEKLNKFNEEQ